jgi:hypothetical protein
MWPCKKSEAEPPPEPEYKSWSALADDPHSNVSGRSPAGDAAGLPPAPFTEDPGDRDPVEHPSQTLRPGSGGLPSLGKRR